MSVALWWGNPSDYGRWASQSQSEYRLFLVEEAKAKKESLKTLRERRAICEAKEKGKPYIPKPEKQKATTPVEKDSPEVVVPVIGKTVIETKRKLLVITRQEKEKAEQLKQQQAAEEATAKKRLEGKPEKRILNLKLKAQGGGK